MNTRKEKNPIEIESVCSSFNTIKDLPLTKEIKQKRKEIIKRVDLLVDERDELPEKIKCTKQACKDAGKNIAISVYKELHCGVEFILDDCSFPIDRTRGACDIHFDHKRIGYH